MFKTSNGNVRNSCLSFTHPFPISCHYQVVLRIQKHPTVFLFTLTNPCLAQTGHLINSQIEIGKLGNVLWRYDMIDSHIHSINVRIELQLITSYNYHVTSCPKLIKIAWPFATYRACTYPKTETSCGTAGHRATWPLEVLCVSNIPTEDILACCCTSFVRIQNISGIISSPAWWHMIFCASPLW